MELAPQSVDDVTAEWLTRALQSKHPGVTIDELSAEPATFGTTTRMRISVRYARNGREAGLPEALFVKCHAQNPNHEYLTPLGIYESEVSFYREIAERLPIPTARALVAEMDEKGGFLLVFEDLVASGATWGSALRPLTESQARAVVRTMSAYHAAFWDDDAPPAWLQQVGVGALHDNFVSSHSHEYYVELVESPRASSLVGPLRDPKKLRQAFDEVQRRNAQGPLCLIHGDPHVANIAFTAKDEPILTDWQIVRRGRAAYDLAYCLGGGLAVEDRRAWLDDLLELYRTELAGQGVAVPRLDPIRDAVAESIIHGLVMFLANRDTMLPEEINRTYAERYAAAATELGSLELLAS